MTSAVDSKEQSTINKKKGQNFESRVLRTMLSTFDFSYLLGQETYHTHAIFQCVEAIPPT